MLILILKNLITANIIKNSSIAKLFKLYQQNKNIIKNLKKLSSNYADFTNFQFV